MRHRIVQIASILLVLGLTGCSWFGGDKDEESRDPFPLTNINPEVVIKTVWSTRIGQGSQDKYTRLVPAIDGDRIFAASIDGRVMALELANGRKIWEVNLQDIKSGQKAGGFFSFGKGGTNAVSGGVGVGNELVLVGTDAGQVVGLNQSDGSLAWTSTVSSEVLSPPQINGDIAVAQSIDGKVAGFDPLDGTRRWTYSTSVPKLTLRGTSTPILLPDIVIAAFANGRVVVLNTDQGLPLWEQKVAVSQGQSELEKLVDIDGAMVVQANRLFIASYQGRLIALDINNGVISWQHPASSFSGVGSGFGQIYLAAENSVLITYDMDSSKEIWRIDALTYRDVTSPITIGNYIVVGDVEGYIHLLAQTDGRFVGRKKVDGDGIRATVLADGNRLYVLGNSGKLTALAIQ
jgi:outer membrane protein assembly factor BamB